MCTELNHFANVKLSIGIDVLDRQLDVSAGIEAMVDIVQGFAVTGSVVV